MTGGFEQPVCPSGAAQAVEVTMKHGDADVTLTWTHQTANGAYEVHRSTTPFFTPGSTTPLKTVFAPVNSYIDKSAAGNPDENPTSCVVNVAHCGATSASNGRIQLPSGAWEFDWPCQTRDGVLDVQCARALGLPEGDVTTLEE